MPESCEHKACVGVDGCWATPACQGGHHHSRPWRHPLGQAWLEEGRGMGAEVEACLEAVHPFTACIGPMYSLST